MKKIRFIIAVFIIAVMTLHGCSFEHQHEFKRMKFDGQFTGDVFCGLDATIADSTKIEDSSTEKKYPL